MTHVHRIQGDWTSLPTMAFENVDGLVAFDPTGKQIIESPTVEFQLLAPSARQPTQSHAGDVGWDLYVSRSTYVPARAFADVPVDVAIALPDGYWARITGRSSAHRKLGLLVAEGIIDQGYRGDLFFGVWNMTDAVVQLEPGQRVAQLIIQRIEPVIWREVEELPASERGAGGFGSTGQ
jgi:dUTP pyrophosphatase